LAETAEFLEAGNNPGLRYVLSCGQVGAMTVTLPPIYNQLLLKDGRVHIMRSVNGGPAAREGGSCFLIRKWDFASDYTTITAVHANDIMRRRIAAYAYIDASSDTDTYDDLIKFVYRSNNEVVALITPARLGGTTQYDISAYVSVQPNLSVLASAFKRYGYRNCLDVIQEVADAATLAGTYLTAEIVAPTESTLEVQTFTGQRGVDRRFSTGNGLLFTSNRGNLENAILTIDAIEEITLAIAGGTDRDIGVIAMAQDTTRMAASPFGRIEQFFDSTAGASTDLQSDADSAVRAARPIIHAVGDLVETDQCVRGVDFDYGDLLTVEIQGSQYDMRLNVMEVTLTASGERTVARFEYNG
jgi:hypothetical protein